MVLNEALKNKLQEQLNISIEWHPTCSSTNDIAAMKAQDGFRGIIGSDYQTHGRGRLDRDWESEAGNNLLFSWVLDIDVPLVEVARIPLLWSAAIAEVLELHVKWPNDVVCSKGHKVGGVLSLVHKVGPPHTIIIGIGLNVNQQKFSNDFNATSLSLDKGQEQSRSEVFESIIHAIHSVNPSDTFDLWRERTHMLGQTVTIQDRQGIATGIREDGALIVDGIPITTGDVHLVEM